MNLFKDAIQFQCYPANNALMLRGGAKVRININKFCNLFAQNTIYLVIMPPSALEQLSRLNIEYPMLFKLTNPTTEKITHCGVLEFIADEDKIYLPYWVRNTFTHYFSLMLLNVICV